MCVSAEVRENLPHGIASIVRAHAAPFPVRGSSNEFRHFGWDAEHSPGFALMAHAWPASLGRLHEIFRFALPVLDCLGDWTMVVGAAKQRSENDGT